jgi:hypothetical protein
MTPGGIDILVLRGPSLAAILLSATEGPEYCHVGR